MSIFDPMPLCIGEIEDVELVTLDGMRVDGFVKFDPRDGVSYFVPTAIESVDKVGGSTSISRGLH